MKTWTALIAKYILTLFFALLAFSWIAEGNQWAWVAAVALAGTVLNYVLGDLVILPSAGNIIASIADGGVGALVAYGLSLITPAFRVSITSLVIFAILITVGEYFFHLYLLSQRKVAP